MKKAIELKQERQSKVTAQENLYQLAVSENRDFTEAESAQFDALQGEIQALDAKIRQAETMEQNRAAMAAAAGAAAEKGEKKEQRKLARSFSISRAINLIKSNKELDGIEGEMSQEAKRENERAQVRTAEGANLHIPSFIMRADGQSVSEDSGAYGGAAIVNQAPMVQSGFTPALFLEELGATRMSGLSGGDIPLPVFNDYNFAWLSETGAITSQKAGISGPTLSPKRLAAAVPVSNRWLLQSTTGDGLIMAKIAKGYDNALQAAAINGSGTGNEPEGILNNSGVLLSGTTAAADPTWAMMVELQGLIEAANASEDSLAYLLRPNLKARLKTTAKDAGSGRFLMEGGTIDGYTARATTLVPTLSGNDVLIYGDFSQLFIGEWGAVSLVVDPYSRLKENSIEIVVNAHADVAIAQPSAFAVNKFLND